ncbi:hypothetical protein SASPL_148960 [Salvia splendens]|uniref:Uncharacterized protein n=1 Tax=Salvia splendens TaxID=180675 RepID=A0A8X8WAB4_SALSN|nr:uncharacterized protein LOC121778080 [Salvia splendens]KAG6391207.1 hypothetical protein SASPL_148960 [Salvia splendens]
MNSLKQNQEFMLRESIKHFLTSYHNGSSDYSSFESIFFRLIQTMLDPPLEITWFYAAVTFHTAKRNSPASRVLIAKDLLNLFTQCSNLSSASKKIALLAPVVYDLYSIVCDSRMTELHERIEVGKLVENMVCYMMVSAGVYDYGNEDVECDTAVVCFEDLIRVWTTDRGGGSCSFVETLRMFFPLLSDGTWTTMNAGCGIRELVGIVQLEVFFLRLYVSFSSGMYTEDALKDARDQAVQTIKGFRNIYFLDMLLKMLSGPSLPIAASMSYGDAVLLHKVMYDAVILVDYSFYSGRWIQSSASQLKKLALAWVLATDQAIQFASAATEKSWAISYLNAFKECHLVAELIKWVCNQAGIVDLNTIPDITNPRALIQWLLVLNDQGINVFDQSMSLLHAKAAACISKVESETPELTLRTGYCHMNIIDLNASDESEDREMGDQPNTSALGGFCLTSMENGTGRKRKEALSSLHEPQVKQVKLDHLGDKLLSLSRCGPDSGGPLVQNIAFDDDMELVG